MHPIFKSRKKEIEQYCYENGLSASKVLSSAHFGKPERVFTQHVDYSKSKWKPFGDAPAPITLKIFLENGKLRFEQTEFTRLYLGSEVQVEEPAMA